jgi:succinate dehydrogenase/fumarate reductase flavoprotein subunit
MAKRTVKVAVVGSGLAGLTAAYRLAKTPCIGDVEFEVHVFEKVRHIRLSSSVLVSPSFHRNLASRLPTCASRVWRAI